MKFFLTIAIFLGVSLVPVFAQEIGCTSFAKSFGTGYRDTATEFSVAKLQNFLSNKGFFDHEVTGYFGQVTKAALIQYQLLHIIKPTGYLGPYTRETIQKETCKEGEKEVTVCTLEVRFCPDGSIMPRNTKTCAWLESTCGKPSKEAPKTICGYQSNGQAASVYEGTPACTEATVGSTATGMPNVRCVCSKEKDTEEDASVKKEADIPQVSSEVTSCSYLENGHASSIYLGTAKCTESLNGKAIPGFPSIICTCGKK